MDKKDENREIDEISKAVEKTANKALSEEFHDGKEAPAGDGGNSPAPKQKGTWEVVFSKKTLICIIIGFSSGLPLYLLISMLPVWLKDYDIDIKVAAFFGLTQLPYNLKFLWAPFTDSVQYKGFGRRKTWMIASQVALVAIIMSMGFFNPSTDLTFISVMCVMLAFVSATQDIVIDAYRREILDDNELGFGNSIHVNAYRISQLVPGSLAIIIANYASWKLAFFVTAMFMVPGAVFSLFAREPVRVRENVRNWRDTVIMPFKDFFIDRNTKNAIYILLFIFLYKLGDSMATSMASYFYLDMGFSKVDLGLVVKNVGLWTTIIFGVIGGIWMIKLGINRALWIFGFVQIFTIPGFSLLAHFGPFPHIGWQEQLFLSLVVGAESMGIGLGTAAFVAFIARCTNPLYTATQLAILTALSAVPRTVVSSWAGVLIKKMGYFNFFNLCFILAIPGMLMLFKVAPWNGDKKAEKSKGGL